MLDNTETKKALDKFLKDVIKQSRKNLKDKKINASRSLSKSLKGNVKVSPNSFQATLFAEDYLPFIDRGVKGVKGGKSLGELGTNKQFKYTNKMPPVRFINTWIKQKSGKFRQRGQKNLAFAIQRKIFNYGIRPTKFFTTPFEKEFKELPDELIEAYGLDIETFAKAMLDNG